MATRTITSEDRVSKDIFNKWLDILEKNNIERGCKKTNGRWDEPDRSYYSIEVTGLYQSYYTLWRHSSNGVHVVNDYAKYNFNGGNSLVASHKYVKNLSQDFEDACKKAMEFAKDTLTPVVLYSGENRKYQYDHSENIFHFGKYNGRNIQEVASEDINYIFFVEKYLSELSFQRNRYGKPMLSQQNKVTLDKVKEAISLHYEIIKEKNRNESVAQYVGAEGEKIFTLELSVEKSFISTNSSYDGKDQEVITAVDADGNLFNITITQGTKNYKAQGMNAGYPKGTAIKIKSAIIKKQYEKLGIKFNRISNVVFE